MSLKLGEIYRLAIEKGMENDVRTKEEIASDLARVQKRYEKMDVKEKDRFDTDALWNPYADCRVLFGDLEKEVRTVLWGIDIATPEVLLADRLREKGRRIDALISHHPIGRARARLHEAMPVLEYLMRSAGVPITTAEDILGPRMREIRNLTAVDNHMQTIDAARLLDIPLMCLHSCTDNLVQRFIEKLVEERRPERIEDILELLLELPEFDRMARNGNGPEVYVGDRGRRAGKIMVKMCGGTSGPKEMFEELSDAGVGTYMCMHLPENQLEEAKKHHINIIITGHEASDSLGVNLLADEVEARGVEVVPFSGLIRVKRN
ncbi:MAG: NGG1p interacting factor NIF3 [Methanomassiliicoccales archaeon]|nr:MAG: NGG1p interacting factor NIF3 [Methanomassiliicoccales archaeon]